MKVVYLCIIFSVNNSEDMPMLIKPADLEWLLFTRDHPRSHEFRKHLVSVFLKEN